MPYPHRDVPRIRRQPSRRVLADVLDPAALETGDITVWQRIVVAIKRDPYGRTARQVEEVLETAAALRRLQGAVRGAGARPQSPGGQRARRGRPPRAAAAGALRSRASRSSPPASAWPPTDLADLSGRERQPAGLADDPDAPAVRPIRQDAGPAGERPRLTPTCGRTLIRLRCNAFCVTPAPSRWSAHPSNPARPSYDVFDYLARHSHYELYPVNPTITDIDGTAGVSQPVRSSGGARHGRRVPAPRGTSRRAAPTSWR